MLSAFVLSSFLSAIGLGDEAKNVYTCTDPAFFIVRNESQITDNKYLQLKGTVSAPQQGYQAAFQFVSVEGPHAYAIISAGQRIASGKPFGRGLPSTQQIQIDQKFNVPNSVGLVHIRVQGLTQQPYEFTCDISQAPQQKPD